MLFERIKYMMRNELSVGGLVIPPSEVEKSKKIIDTPLAATAILL